MSQFPQNQNVRKARIPNVIPSLINLLLPVCILVTILVLSKPAPLVLIPNTSLKFKPYCDRSENGNTEINYFKEDSSVVYAYTLKKGFAYPYAGLAINADSNNFFDLHKFDRILITIKTSSSNSVRIFIRTYQDSITKPRVPLSQRYNEIQIPARCTLRTNIFPFSEIVTPDWWYETNKIVPRQTKPSNYVKVIGIDLNNGYSTEIDKPDTLTVTEFKLYRTIQPLIVKSTIFLILYYISFSCIVVMQRRKKRVGKNIQVNIIPYWQLEITSCSEDDLKKVVSFLACNFSDPDISVQKVALATKLSTYKVPSIIKSEFRCSFKEYLNRIRIEEAKRLLSTTDRQVTEIAFAIGYNSPPHFNRQFKELTGKSPREFRQQAS